MIINDEDAAKRLNSPMNLINRLKSSTSPKQSAMNLFGLHRPASQTPAPLTPDTQALIIKDDNTTLDKILENHESQIKLGLAHDNALKLLNDSVSILSAKLEDVKADKLPAVISSASRVVESIRRERNEASKNNKDREVHYHFYTPEQKDVSEYKVIEVQ